jgi:hypothetical protein
MSVKYEDSGVRLSRESLAFVERHGWKETCDLRPTRYDDIRQANLHPRRLFGI